MVTADLADGVSEVPRSLVAGGPYRLGRHMRHWRAERGQHA